MGRLGYLGPDDYGMEPKMWRSMTRQVATGIGKGKYDKAVFRITAEAHAASGPQAKALVEERVKAIQDSLEQLRASGVDFQADETQSNFEIYQEYRWSNGDSKPNGYRARYTIKLETTKIEDVSKIQDIFTSLDGVSVGSPHFSLSHENKEKLQQAAVASAYQAIYSRFNQECKVMGLNPKDYTIDSWQTHYHDDHAEPFFLGAAMMQMASKAAGAAPINVESGSATVKVRLIVNFSRRK